jgi:hypothetical protein
MRLRGREKKSGRHESERGRSHASTIAALVLVACAGKPEPVAQPAKPAPIDAGVDAPQFPQLPRRWLEVAFFDALGTVLYRAPSDTFKKCFERVPSERGYAMLLLVDKAWTTEDANGLERETIACLKAEMEHDDPKAEKPARVYVVFR